MADKKYKINFFLEDGRTQTVEFTAPSGADGKDGRDGIDGKDGEKGDKGETGERGADGSDATVTKENIYSALGYTPANDYDVTQLKSDLNELSNMKSGAIIQTASGENIVAKDSSDDALRGLRLFGKTEQFTTTGKNLIDIAISTATSTTKKIPIELEPGNYIFRLYNENRSTEGIVLGSTYSVRLEDSNGNTVVPNIHNGATVTAEQAEQITTLVCIFINTYYTDSSPYLYGQLEKGMTTTPYEPYTGGIPSPNPQYPQELVSAGDDGNVEVKVYGKNLLDFEGCLKAWGAKYTKEGEKYTITSIGQGYSSPIILFDEPTDVYIQGALTNIGGTGCRLTLLRIVDGTISTVGDLTSETTGFTRLANAIRLNYSTGGSFTVENLCMESGKVNTGYEPYKGKTLTALTPNGLPAIPVTDASLATYTDADGQMWCADEIDLERGVHVRRVKITNPTFTSVGKESNGNTYAVFQTDDKIKEYNKGAICSKSILIASNADKEVGTFYENKVNLLFVGEPEDTLETMRTKYGDAEIMYILATPIETPLSEEELATYKALHSNYPVTTIMNDSGAHMGVKYNADTKLYIDNKFAEMTNAILSMGGNV